MKKTADCFGLKPREYRVESPDVSGGRYVHWVENCSLAHSLYSDKPMHIILVVGLLREAGYTEKLGKR